MAVLALIAALCEPGLLAQTGDTTTKGSCSPATSGNNNNFVIQCGVGAEQGKKILDLLNAALRNSGSANAKLDELLALALKPVEPIQLSATIADMTNLSLQIENKSDRTARNILYGAVLFRESDLAFFSFETTDIGFVKSFSKGPAYLLALETKPKIETGAPPMKKGDVLTGQITVDCADCAFVRYIVHLVWGESGWYYEAKSAVPQRPGKVDMTPEGRRLLIQAFDTAAPEPDRVPIH